MSKLDQVIRRASEAFQNGQYDKAEKLALKAAKQAPKDADLRIMAGMASLNRGRPKNALRYLLKGLELSPGHPVGLAQTGLCYLALGDAENSRSYLTEAHHADPDDATILIALGQSYLLKSEKQSAFEKWRDAAILSAADPESLQTIGNLFQVNGAPAEARQHFEKANTLKPDDPDLLADHAISLRDDGAFEEALTTVERAISLSPNESRYHDNRGFILRCLCCFDEAIIAEERAVELEPDNIDRHFQLAVSLLTVGRFEDAWPHYEKRWGVFSRELTYPLSSNIWRGEALSGRSLLVRAEQGIGDEILFSTCLPDLIAETKGENVTVECNARLRPVFARTYPELSFVPLSRPSFGEAQHVGYDLEVPIGSLASIYRPNVGAVENAVLRRLVPDPEVVHKWRTRFSDLPGLKVGIAWRGGVTPVSKLMRSVRLTDFLPILKIPDCTFINLQYGDVMQELKDVKTEHGVTVHEWPDNDPLTDIDSQIAQISALDLVIQVSNSSAHAAGALGVETWILQAMIPNWPWLVDREDMPWYENVHQFRVTPKKDKTVVVQELADQLKRRVAMQASKK